MTERYRALMIGHGATLLFAGLLTGYLLAFNLIETITLWPFPGSIDVRIPGDPARWRGAHTGIITNALMLIAAALCLPHLRVSDRVEKFIVWGLILTVWGNLAFYWLSALGAPGRGLSMGPNRFGGGDAFSQITFLVAYPGALIAPLALLAIARGAFASARAARAPGQG